MHLWDHDPPPGINAPRYEAFFMQHEAGEAPADQFAQQPQTICNGTSTILYVRNDHLNATQVSPQEKYCQSGKRAGLRQSCIFGPSQLSPDLSQDSGHFSKTTGVPSFIPIQVQCS